MHPNGFSAEPTGPRWVTRRRIPASLLVATSLVTGVAGSGCGRVSSTQQQADAGTDAATAGLGGSGGAGVETTGAGQSGDTDPGTDSTADLPEAECQRVEPFVPKRLTRLTFPQLANAIDVLFDEELGALVRREFDLPETHERDFPELSSPREGAAFNDASWQRSDAIGQRVGAYVLDNFARLSGCAADDMGCAEGYLYGLAAKAYRRPLTSAEERALGELMEQLVSTEVSAAELGQYGAYAILGSSAFLYRTEFGSDAEQAGKLTEFELADQLAYTLTDAPPDPELRALAESGRLNEQVLTEQAWRLVETAAAQRNLTGALFSYFDLHHIDQVVVDPAVAPSFDEGMRASMRHEARAFLAALWRPEPFAGLLFGRRSVADAALAALYGIDFPPAGVPVDAQGFAAVELGPERAGILTLPGYLLANSRPDATSVVQRGLQVMADFTCAPFEPFPEDLQDQIPELPLTENPAEAAAIRAAEPTCAVCHDAFDPYGLVLEQFGLLGELRDRYPDGTPIDTHTALPGGAIVENAPGLAAVLAASPEFSFCMTQAWLTYALALVGEVPDACTAEAIARSHEDGPGTLSDLVVAVATSVALSERVAPGAE